ILIVGIANERRRHMHRQRDRLGRRLDRAERLRRDGAGLEQIWFVGHPVSPAAITSDRRRLVKPSWRGDIEAAYRPRKDAMASTLSMYVVPIAVGAVAVVLV